MFSQMMALAIPKKIIYSGARLQETPREQRLLPIIKEVYYKRGRIVKKYSWREFNLTKKSTKNDVAILLSLNLFAEKKMHIT